MSYSDDNDEVTSKDGQESMFGLDFSSLDISNIKFGGDHRTTSTPTTQSVKEAKYDPTFVEKLISHEDKLPPATESNFVELFEWATKQGAQLDNICFQRDRYGGRGLYATQSTPQGGTLAVLPRSLRLGQSDASRILGLPSSIPDLSALTLLILYYCHEGHIYARSLPRGKQFTNALLMSSKEKLTWSKLGDSYAAAIENTQSAGDACCQYIFDCLTSETTAPASTEIPSLYWAISMVKSRSHAFGTKRGYWLTPVFDLVNHSQKPNTALEGDDQGQLILRALNRVDPGDEITIDYQVDEDSKLVANYGFSLVHNYDAIEVLRADG